MKITLSSPVKEILKQWPQTVELFLQFRMSCPGCCLAEFEYLENALHIYNIPKEPFLESLQKIIDKGK